MPTFVALTTHRVLWRTFVAVALILSSVSVVLAGPREQAQRIHDRLAGVPPTETVLTTMTTQIATDPLSAALTATDNPNFYAVTLTECKLFASLQ